jgi:hypothetical protein
MDKALIEKAFEEWSNNTMADETGYDYTKDNMLLCFQAGANWQREQLIKELREWANEGIPALDSYVQQGYVTAIADLLAKLDLLERKK